MTRDQRSVSGRRALLVVDVQRDFCPGGALPAAGCNRIVPVINAYLAEGRELAMVVYASRDWHPAMTTHFKPYGGEWPPRIPGGTFHPRLHLPASPIIISKGD